MRTAKPILFVGTPLGVGWGVIEAWRFHPLLAGLMLLMVSVVAGFTWMTVRVALREQAALQRSAAEGQADD